MGIMKKVGGSVAKKIANSDAVGGAIHAAADTFGQTAAGQTSAGRIARDIAQNPAHREGVIGAAIGMATPGIRNKFRAANTLRGIASDVRGGRGAVSPGQFGHLPPPPGSGSNSSTFDWDANIPGSGSHEAVPNWDAPPPPRHGGSDNLDWDVPPPTRYGESNTPDWMNPNGNWKTPDY
jgi:hypothetical protein